MPQEFHDAALDRLAHHMLPAARLGVHLLPFEPDDVDEQAFGEAVLAHHPRRQPAALLRQLQMPVARDLKQAVSLHARHRLAHRRAALFEPLRDAGAHGHHTLLFQFEDGAEIHLRGVDQSGHACPSMCGAVALTQF